MHQKTSQLLKKHLSHLSPLLLDASKLSPPSSSCFISHVIMFSIELHDPDIYVPPRTGKGKDCHGFEKPVGKCHGLTWGAGMGWVCPTLTIPIPAEAGWQVGSKFKLCLKADQVPSQACQSFHPTLITTHCISPEPWKHKQSELKGPLPFFYK